MAVDALDDAMLPRLILKLSSDLRGASQRQRRFWSYGRSWCNCAG